MLFLMNRFSYNLAVRSCVLVRYSSTISNGNNTDFFHFDPKLSNKDQEKILSTLNSSTAEQLSRFNVSQNRIKSLENWKIKKGPFQSLNEILEVEGLGVKVLEKICQSIINETPHTEKIKSAGNGTKRNRQLVLPMLSGETITGLNSAVGVHLGPTGISWAKLCKNGNKLEYWNYDKFTSLPPKMLPNETFQLAMNILSKIPVADLYIFEATGNMSMQGQNQPSIVASHVQHLELTSMLLTLINTSLKHNSSLQVKNENKENLDLDRQIIINKVYYLRSKLSARLFKTLVGNEKVSANIKISQLLEGDQIACTPVAIEENLKNYYSSQLPADKEILGQALMLIVTFMDICIYKNSASLAEIAPNRK